MIRKVNTRQRWRILNRMIMNTFITVAVIEFSQVGAGFIDGVIVSRFFGADEIAAVGIALPFFSLVGVFGGILAVGMQMRCTQEIGRGNVQKMNEIFSFTLSVGLILSLVLTTVLMLFSEEMAMLFGASGNAEKLLTSTSLYLRGVTLGLPALILNAIIAPAIELDGNQKCIKIGALLNAAFDIVFDVIAVLLGWGIWGIGIATSLSAYVNLMTLLLHFARKGRMVRFVRFHMGIQEFLNMLYIGSNKAVKRVCKLIRPIIVNAIIISYGGAVAMSALAIRNNFFDFVNILPTGIVGATSLLVSIYYGEVNEEAIRSTGSYVHRLWLAVSGGTCVILLVFARPIAGFYVSDNRELMDLCTFAIRALGLQIPVSTLVQARCGYLQAIHKTKNMQIVTILSYLVCVIASSFVMGQLFGTYGILACFTVSELLVLIMIEIYYMIKCRKLRLSPEDYLDLPGNFHLSPGDVISLDVRDLEDASLASEQIILFCKGHKIDKRTGYFAGLCAEELTSNVIKFGFTESRGTDKTIDLRVVIWDHKMVIRICDNCPAFDIQKKIASLMEDSDNLSNIGIRITSKIASDIRYVRMMNTNNVIIQYGI